MTMAEYRRHDDRRSKPMATKQVKYIRVGSNEDATKGKIGEHTKMWLCRIMARGMVI